MTKKSKKWEEMVSVHFLAKNELTPFLSGTFHFFQVVQERNDKEIEEMGRNGVSSFSRKK